MSAALRKQHKRPGEKRIRDAGDDAGSSQDASEEDNDVSDVGSFISVRASANPSIVSTASSSPRVPIGHHLPLHNSIAAAGLPASAPRRASRRVEELSGEISGEGSLSDGARPGSPTYDGDVESSTATPVHSNFHHPLAGHGGTHQTHNRQPSSPITKQQPITGDHQSSTTPLAAAAGIARQPTPKASMRDLLFDGSLSPNTPMALASTRPTDVPVGHSEALSPAKKSQLMPLSTKSSSSALGPPKMWSRPVELSESDIRGFVQRAIDGEGKEDGVERWWKTAPPPVGRPVRIYADGVYDLFHFGHALQLRQAKLSFPSVHLLVGVCSDKLCASHKSAPSMTHAERCEGVRHCRWADEVLPDAPWVVDQAWMDKYEIDYIAHDEIVYPSKDHEDVYAFAKESGKFLPTRRTPAISTSDLLERIVRGYRDGFFDSKLEKNGLPELLAADVDWDSSASVERREVRKKKAQAASQASSADKQATAAKAVEEAKKLHKEVEKTF